MTDDQGEAPGRDSKTNLYEAARAAIKDQETKADVELVARLSATGRRRRVGVMFLLGLIGALLLILRPVWLVGPDAVPPEPPSVAAASLRLGLLRERQRVLDYYKSRGRLPVTLSDAGVTMPDLLYQAQGADSFLLTGQAGDSIITLHSADSMSSFLGSSLAAIRDRGRK